MTEKENQRLIKRGSLLRGRFRIEDVLGERGIGVTYLAEDVRCGKRCVVKHLSLLGAKSTQDFSRFEREARILTNLDHPGIPGFVDYFEESTEWDISVYLVQEYIDGKSLEELLQSGRHFTERQAIEIALELIKVLEYLHGFSPPIIHRAIKPSNILLAPDGRVYLTDFAGVRENLLPVEQLDPMAISTYGYMPPEQYAGKAVAASDLYSLGVTLIVLLSHADPVEMAREDQRLDFRPYVNISGRFASVINRMIERDLDKRYRNVQELKRELGDLLVPVSNTRKRLRRRAVVVGALGLGLAASLYLLLHREPPPQPLPDKRPPSVPSQTIPARKPSPQVLPAQEAERPKKSPVLSGKLLHDGLPITKFTANPATFWFRNESTGKEQAAQVRYQEGAFEMFGLPPGRYGVDVRIRTGGVGYTGNFVAWKTFSIVDEEVRQELNIDLHRIIHMTSPQDNSAGLARWDAKCEGKMSFPALVRFAWEPLGEGTTYGYSIERYRCEPFQRIDTVVDGSTLETQLNVDLLSSSKNEMYLLRLSARKGDLLVGRLETYGINGGRGWDYRFRVD
ncbi:MAG: protein kinase [Candidatus Tectomicrobia bacterium]|uniref:non-specific serine/threonine protein kinase n=1 Tax=Tectimicrobiota bacterium TaxID=2528274 RepID=A0A933LRB9_UNCTE|nr:protein kinase [Candidatus Tectomicrobia bacterium]